MSPRDADTRPERSVRASKRSGGAGRLRIGIDAHAVGRRKTGNERVITNLVQALCRRSDHELFVYVTDAADPELWSDLDQVTLRAIGRPNPLRRLGLSLPRASRRDSLDVLLCEYTRPLHVACPVATMVADVSFARFPEYFGRGERLWLSNAVPLSMRHSARIITVSEFSRSEICSLFGIAPEQVTPIPNGVDPIFTAAEGEPGPRGPIDSAPYFLAVGNIQPRKNLDLLLSAYAELISEVPETPERLVLVGQSQYRADTILERAQHPPLVGRVSLAGFVSDEELAALYRGASAFLYPSNYEGFGLPPLEAMASGAPVAVADIPVMREVVGDAALRLPPADVGAWTAALARLSGERELRAGLIERGRERAAAFSWDRTADLMIETLTELAVAGARD